MRAWLIEPKCFPERMRFSVRLYRFSLMAMLVVWGPVFAQASSTGVESSSLEQKVEEQQRQLDAQQKQLDAQRKALEKLREEVQEPNAQGSQTKSPQAQAGSPQISPYTDTQVRRKDIHTTRRDSAQPNEHWKGSIALEGVDTRLKIGGFVQLNVIHDDDAIDTPGEFVTSAIVTGDASKVEGADGRTSFSIQPSRLYFETRTPVQQHRLTTNVSVDLFGDATSTQADLRLRQAYAEMSNILFGGDILVGLAWSTFTDLEASPNTLDFEGPNSFFNLREPQIRWTRGIGAGLELKVSAETPSNHRIEGADSLTAWPDGVVALTWDSDAAKLMGAFIARDLRASYNNGPTETALGWGASVSGSIHLPAPLGRDFVTFSLTSGEGIGSAFNDSPPDAAFDTTTNQLEAIPSLGWFTGYQHWWAARFYSVFVYGVLKQSNLSFQPSSAFSETQYTSGNLVWMPVQNWMLGAELLYGTREDYDGSNGDDVRMQFTSKFIF